VIPYDLGKALPDGKFERTASLNAPPKLLLTALSQLQARGEGHEYEFVRYLVEGRLPREVPRYKYPGATLDKLFQEDYSHVDEEDTSCEQCLPMYRVPRAERKSTDPKVHYGTIGSGGLVVSDVSIRKGLEKDGVLCIETKASGLMNDFLCLVIRGVFEHCDSHKNKVWYRYAALAAAAVAKEIMLNIIPYEQIPPLLPIAVSTPSDSFLVFRSDEVPNEGAGLGWLVCDPCSPWDDFCRLQESLRASDIALTPQQLVADLLDATRGTSINTKVGTAVSASLAQHVEMRSDEAVEKSYFRFNSGNYFRRICGTTEVQELCERRLLYEFNVYMIVALRTIEAKSAPSHLMGVSDCGIDLQTGCIGKAAKIVAIQYGKVGCNTSFAVKNHLSGSWNQQMGASEGQTGYRWYHGGSD
jgi:hypothetical protein